MNTFSDRIDPNPAHMIPFVEMTEDEMDSAGYRGCGDCVAVVLGDRIEEIVYLDSRTTAERLNTLETMVSETGDLTLWQGMASCGSLCEPWRLTADTFHAVRETWEFENAA